MTDTEPGIQDKSQRFKVIRFNSQSCRNKTDDVCDLITQGSYDLVSLTETWLRPTGDECEMAAVTPAGFTCKSVPKANGTGGGLAVLFRNSLVDCVKVSTKDLAFKSLEVCKTPSRPVSDVPLCLPPTA